MIEWPRLKALLQEAEQAGYTVVIDNYSTFVYKLDRKKRAYGLILFNDGTGLCLDVPHSRVKNIRSYREMRHFLKLPKESRRKHPAPRV